MGAFPAASNRPVQGHHQFHCSRSLPLRYVLHRHVAKVLLAGMEIEQQSSALVLWACRSSTVPRPAWCDLVASTWVDKDVVIVVFLQCSALSVCPAGAVDDEGRVWVWGQGSNWQLGHGARHHDCEPQQVCATSPLSHC